MAVEPVEYSMVRKGRMQVSRLQRDGFLLVKGDPEVWIQSNPADLLSVRFLELTFVEKIGDSIGQLSHLKHLFIIGQNLKFLPNSISSLPNLQRLELHCCFNLQELPANLGDLNSLTFLSLDNCNSIKSLPNSISKLSNLTSLHLLFCKSLKELPAISNVVELKLFGSDNIQSLPKGLCNLKKLHLYACRSLTELPTDLNLLQLKIEYCCSIQSLPKILTNLQLLHLPRCSKILSLANLIYFRSLWHLTFENCCSCGAHLKELPANLCELSELLTLNIKDTTIKWLPWSITKLSKLRLLSLSGLFRLETLPNHLKDSIVISVEGRHIRKTWQQLKTEIQLFDIPIVRVEATHTPSTPGYLLYRTDPGPWIQSNNLHSLVRILDLESRDRNLINPIWKLPELTHLYISNRTLFNLPLMLTRLTHLCLSSCDLKSCFDSLGKLSTLESLTLFQCMALPEHLDLPVSLTHFALEYCEFDCEFDSIPDSYMASMRKLSNMKTLYLSGYDDLELSQLNMNLTKLRVRHCFIKSLPRCLQRLEIMHSPDFCFEYGRCWDNLQVCLSQVVNLGTLSVTCYDIEVLPSIAGHQTLQELQLKDCFNLRKLQPNLNELVELCTLNVSGTRIKSLPNSITKLQNLGHLTLSKCFIRKSLPKNFEDKVRVFDDDTDDMYYQHAGYYGPCYDSSEDDEITLGCTEGGDEVVSQESTHDSVIEQASSQSLLKPQPIANQVDEGSPLISRTVPIDNGFSSSQNLEMEILPIVNKDCVASLGPTNFSSSNETDGHHFSSNILGTLADQTALEGLSLNGRIDAVGESNSFALCNRDYAINFPDDFAAISSSNLHESQQCFRDAEMDIINSENGQRNQLCDLINSVHGEIDYNALEDGQDKNPQSVYVKHKKTHKIEVSEESIRQCMSQNMRLEDAAKHLNLKRSTMKRRLKEYGITWTRNRRRKQHEDAKNKEHNTKSPSERNCSQLSLVEPSNSAGQDHRVEHIDGSCSTFDVKATYKGDIVRIYRFSLSSGIEQLKEKVGEKLGLEVGKFKMKFLDEDNDLILMSCISDLQHALRLSKSSGSSVVKLSVILSEN